MLNKIIISDLVNNIDSNFIDQKTKRININKENNFNYKVFNHKIKKYKKMIIIIMKKDY